MGAGEKASSEGTDDKALEAEEFTQDLGNGYRLEILSDGQMFVYAPSPLEPPLERS